MAKTSSLKKKLLVEIADLPDDKLQEVIEFVGYLKAEADEAKSGKEPKLDPKKNPLWKLIGMVAHGALAQDIDRDLYGELHQGGTV